MNRRHLLIALLAAALPLAAESVTAGKYSGKWEGASGASGDFHITLTSAGDTWSADVNFGLGGQDVKCKVKSVSVDGSKIRVVYSFDLQGTELESTIEGERSDKGLGGKYTTRTTGDGSAVDEGTWQTTAAE